MNKINFQNIRTWNGSQNEAFEELCCQLAEYESVLQGSTFIRKAPPDAGLECFWILPNGDECGWQAKFFLHPPEKSQWKQIDHSVKTAFEKHPRLTSYTICLPIDRQDPRIDDQQWFMDKWKEHVKKWMKWARDKDMSVEFHYWGAHEIVERLSRDEHRGRHFFWFNKELFTQQWFENHIQEAVANVGPRYTPELNVQLPIVHLFDGIGRTPSFFKRIKALHGKIKKTYLRVRSRRKVEFVKNAFASLHEHIYRLFSVLEDVEEFGVNPINFDSIVTLASKSREIAWRCIQSLEKAANEEKATFSEEQERQAQKYKSDDPLEDLRYERNFLYELIRSLFELGNFGQSNVANLANIPALLLIGDAGTGKTHLFCDIAKQKNRFDLPVLLLLGGQFANAEPWSQIIHHLGLSCNREELLGALEASAQAAGSRALILIDALNEGEGKYLWSKHLAGMLTALSRYPWIGIAISVRTSYEEVVIPKEVVPNKLIRERHLGFTEYEYEATQTFFEYYDIEQPSIPLLVPEFQNPMFLKLFCQGLNNRGMTKIPSGLHGLTTIFNFFIDSVNDKLSKPEYLDFDSKSQIVQGVTAKLAKMMADKTSTWLPREEAYVTVNAFLHRNGYEKSLFRHLISEGLLTEDRFRIDDDRWCEGVHFSYERFTDSLITKHLLDKHLDLANPSRAFKPNQPLGSFIQDERACWRNRGLIEALSIQIPECIGKELAEVASYCADWRPIREAFVESLIWRDPTTITNETLNYINKHVIKYEDTLIQFLNALLTIASNPDHPYNADFLHKQLMKMELAQRDAWWSIFLHHQYEVNGPIDRLVDWAWSYDNKNNIDDESIRLYGIALAWCLTTANRYLRDRATKALVSLFTNRMHVLIQIIRTLLMVNDPYVLERLFAVAYGCAMRSVNNEAIGELAKEVYERIFANGEPPPHVLLRDYARGIVELALYKGIELDIEVEKIRPPYESEWPLFKIPTEEELKKHSEWQEGMPDDEGARLLLYRSVMGFGDFARYIIGTNLGQFEWSSRRLGEPRKPSRKEIYEAFVLSLTNKQKKAWDQYHNIRMNIDFYRRLDRPRRLKTFEREFNEEELEIAITSSEQSLRKALGKKKLMIFEENIIPYLDDPSKDEYSFDLSIAQQWIFQRVLDLGWSVERFGRFDVNVSRYSHYGRGIRKSERMGKKYQWIAYHEFLARVSDNFEFRGERWPNRPSKYDGPWQLFIRDIDPSCLLKKTRREMWQSCTNTWWFPSSYSAWEVELDDLTWLKKSENLPEIKQLIEVTKPDGSKWLTLEAFYRWEQPTPPNEDRFEIPRRDIWYMLKSYIVKKPGIDILFRWAKKQNFSGRWMPESREVTRVFLGEFFWSPAFRYFSTPYYHHDEWTRGPNNCIPKEVMVSTDQYRQEYAGYDCSIDESIHIYLPAKWLTDHMNLEWNAVEGSWFDANNNLIAFDPSIWIQGPGALLANQDVLLRFLEEKGYDLIWIILGEKNILGIQRIQDAWKGRLELSGAYRVRGKKVKGSFKTRFIS